MRRAAEWRAIPGLAGYEASADGRVRRVRACRNGWRPRELKGWVGPLGYRSIGLLLAGRKVTLHVHRLVALAFLGLPPSPRHQVAHADGNPKNNSATNLRWATPKENAADRRRHGREPIGARNGRAKLSEADVKTLFRLAAKGMGARAIAARLGISAGHVHAVLKGRSWRHVKAPYAVVSLGAEGGVRGGIAVRDVWRGGRDGGGRGRGGDAR